MGQKIEQWVYAQLGFPELAVVGDVRTNLNKTECPGWINHSIEKVQEQEDQSSEGIDCRVLFKGPCDLSHSLVYIKGSSQFDTEFTYVSNSDGQIIDAHNHSVHIEGLYTYSEQEKEEIVNDCIFIDPAMLNGGFFTKGYDVINALRNGVIPKHLMVTVHPQRWNPFGLAWCKELILQNTKNIVKRILIKTK